MSHKTVLINLVMSSESHGLKKHQPRQTRLTADCTMCHGWTF